MRQGVKRIVAVPRSRSSKGGDFTENGRQPQAKTREMADKFIRGADNMAITGYSFGKSRFASRYSPSLAARRLPSWRSTVAHRVFLLNSLFLCFFAVKIILSVPSRCSLNRPGKKTLSAVKKRRLASHASLPHRLVETDTCTDRDIQALHRAVHG